MRNPKDSHHPESNSHPGSAAWAVRVTGAMAMFIGGFWLVAWLGGWAAQWSAAAVLTVKTNMALGQLLAGVALLLLAGPVAGRQRRAVGTGLAALVLLIGACTLSQHLFGLDLGIDQLLATEARGAVATASPNRMGPPGSLSLTLLGTGLLALAWSRKGMTPYLGLVVCVINLLPAVGFLYGIKGFYGLPRLTGIAWPTVVALVSLGAGLLLAYTRGGPMAALLRPDAGGVLIRKMLPAVILVPLAMGLLQVHTQYLGITDTAMGTGLLVITLILVFAGFLWRSAAQLSREEAAACAAEEALQQSEKQFRMSVETMVNGFAILSAIRDEAGQIADFRYKYINEAGCRMNGRSREDSLGRSYTELFPGIKESDWFRNFVRIVETGEPFIEDSWVYTGVLPGGEQDSRAFDIRIVKMGDGIAASWLDVTERKKTEAIVARLASFPELNPNLVVEIDPEGVVCYANPTARKLFPDLEEAGSSHPWLAGLREVTDRFRRGEERQTSRVVAADGRHYHQSIRYIDAIQRIRVYSIDISERISAEEALRASEARYRSLAENMPSVLMRYDRDLRVVYLNPKSEEYTGIPIDRFIGRTNRDVGMPEPLCGLWEEAIRDVFHKGRDRDLEFEFPLPEGTKTFYLKLAPERDPDGAVGHVLGVSTDVTELKAMEKALKASLAAKEVLFKELSHRTKNNMQVIVGLLSLQATELGDGKLIPIIMEAQNRIRSLALVHENLYRSGSVTSLSMKVYFRDLLTLLLQVHQGDDGPVKPVLDLEEIFLSIDAAQPCGLIINELVTNSLKHAFPDRKAGRIYLSLRQREDDVELAYRDDGPGLPRDLDLSRIKSLGLKLVYNLAVHQLRGTVDLRHDPRQEFIFRFRDIDIMKRVVS